MDLLKILVAVLLPPVGVFLEVGFGKHFWLNILLTLLGYLPGIIHALVRIPGTRIRVGLDSMLGLVPGIGDLLALVPAGYIVAQAARMGATPSLLVRMGANIGLDAAIGAVPLIGDIFDIGWKANRRNVGLLRRHLDRHPPAQDRA